MAPKHIKTLIFFLDLLSYLVPNFANDNVRKGFFGESQSDAEESHR